MQANPGVLAEPSTGLTLRARLVNLRRFAVAAGPEVAAAVEPLMSAFWSEPAAGPEEPPDARPD